MMMILLEGFKKLRDIIMCSSKVGKKSRSCCARSCRILSIAEDVFYYTTLKILLPTHNNGINTNKIIIKK